MLVITVGKTPLKEEEYVFKHIFENLWGIEYCIKIDTSITDQYYILHFSDIEDQLFLPRIFFNLYERYPFSKKSLPSTPLNTVSVDFINKHAKVTNSTLPVLFHREEIPYSESIRNSVKWLPLDVFGSLFYLISRYEELVITDRDQHGRFSAYHSVAYKGNFLDRPICDEYLIVLKEMLKLIAPQFKTKSTQYKLILTCDIDTPYESYLKKTSLLPKRIYSDLFKRGDMMQAIKSVLNFISSPLGFYKFDSYDTFDWMINVANKHLNSPIIFYVLVDIIESNFNGNYRIDEKRIIKLLKKITKYGHVIGSHGSYSSFNDFDLWNTEITTLKEILNRENIQPILTDVRQHYLRWSHDTLKNYKAEVQYIDSTLGFADHPGFRCGTCYDFPLFSFSKKSEINVVERPLIVMEDSVISKSYLNLGTGEAAFKEIKKLALKCKAVDGNFTLLWHNSSLKNEQERSLFYRCLNELA